VESVPGKRSGACVFKNTRMPVSTVFENLSAGLGVQEIMEEFSVTHEQINAVLLFAAKSLEAPPPAEAAKVFEGASWGPPKYQTGFTFVTRSATRFAHVLAAFSAKAA